MRNLLIIAYLLSPILFDCLLHAVEEQEPLVSIDEESRKNLFAQPIRSLQELQPHLRGNDELSSEINDFIREILLDELTNKQIERTIEEEEINTQELTKEPVEHLHKFIMTSKYSEVQRVPLKNNFMCCCPPKGKSPAPKFICCCPAEPLERNLQRCCPSADSWPCFSPLYTERQIEIQPEDEYYKLFEYDYYGSFFLILHKKLIAIKSQYEDHPKKKQQLDRAIKDAEYKASLYCEYYCNQQNALDEKELSHINESARHDSLYSYLFGIAHKATCQTVACCLVCLCVN